MGKRQTIEGVKAFALNKGGICLSTEYNGPHKHLIWECGDCKNQWPASFSNIKAGKWCPPCSYRRGGTKNKFTQQEINEIIANKGGVCLSTYNAAHEKLQIRCANGHIFMKAINKILHSGQWCQICSSSIAERICREYFERIFNKPFPSIRPANFLSDKGGHLELDGYCAELMLAFEHNGMQHYEEKSYITHEAFERLQHNDRFKAELAKSLGIRLVIIPQLYEATKLKDLKQLIKIQCLELGVYLPEDFDDIVIDTNKLYYINVKAEMGTAIPSSRKYSYNDVANKAKEKGGECLSVSYNGHFMQFRCEAGHAFEIQPSTVMDGSWCGECHRENIAARKTMVEAKRNSPIMSGRKYTYDDVANKAKSRNGKCLSVSYGGDMKFKCNAEHVFDKQPSLIMDGEWCGKCRAERAAAKKIRSAA